ncbi:MAG: choice-of-anchor A family protein, partial [Ruminococcus sp.]|nr:choice-of-anchor A family protein [Ruminococcus sp.]
MNKLKTRSISFITAFMMSIMSIVTGISPPTFAADNLGSKDAVDDVTLLVGSQPTDPDGKPYDKTFATVAEAINRYDSDFALGIVSQFSVFLTGDFIPHNSDAEGRVAIGGNIDAQGYPWDSYNIGKGHFVNGDMSVKLEDLLLGNKDFAHVIWGANGKDGKDSSDLKFDAKIDANESDKKIVVETDAGADFIKKEMPDRVDSFYQGNLIDIQAEMAKLQTRSEKLAKHKNQFEIKFSEIGGDYDYTNDANGNGPIIATVKYTGDTTKPTDTIYFNLDELSPEDYEKFKKASIIRFENIPKLEEPRIISQVDSDAGEKAKEVKWEYSYIVINDSKESATLGYQHKTNDGWTVKQYISIKGVDADKAINISQTGSSSPWLEYDPETGTNSYKLTNFSRENGDGTNGNNNEAGVTSILYNLPNAKDVIVCSNIQGTVLAPNAFISDSKFLKEQNKLPEGWTMNVDTGDANPHISGAVIANSFEGNIEFGYRPFTGPRSMLGSVSGYALELSKVDNSEPKKYISGAVLGLVEIQDGKEVVVSDVETNNNEYDFVTVPSSIDTSNADTDKDYTKNYILKEISAPAGYEQTADTYAVRIVEDVKEVKEFDGRKVPTIVEVSIYRGKVKEALPTDEEKLKELLIRHLTYTDGYNDEGEQISRTIVIDSPIQNMTGTDLASVKITFELTIKDGKVTDITQTLDGKTEKPVTDYNTSEEFKVTFNNTDSQYYYDAENMMITRIPLNNVPTFVNNQKEIRLVKVAASDNTITLQGAGVEVYKAEDIDKANRKPVAQGTTDDKGVLELGHLEPGEYCIVETKAPVVGEDKYIAPKTPIKFTVTPEYKITGDAASASDSYPVTYTVSGDTTEYKTTIGDGVVRTLKEGIPSAGKDVDSFIGATNIELEGNEFETFPTYNAENKANYNINCEGKTITKVIVKTGDGKADGGGFYIKNEYKNGTDIFNYSDYPGNTADYCFFVKPNQTYEFTQLKADNATFGKDGYLYVGGWDVAIKSIEYFVEGLSTSEVDTTKKVNSITIKCDKSLEGTSFSLDIGAEEPITGTVNEEGICTFEINGTLGKFPRLTATHIQTNTINIIPFDSEGENKDSTIEFKLPNRKQRSDKPYIEINKINMRGVEVVGAELVLTIKEGTTINGKDKELTWTSDSNDTFVIEDIQEGTYILTETKAPNGYIIADPIEFEVNKDGKIVSVNGDEVKDGKLEKDKEFVLSTEKDENNKEYSLLEMRDGRLLKLKKTDSTGKPLERAIFELSATDITSGEPIEFNQDIVEFDKTYWSYSDDGTVITWNSRGIPAEGQTEAAIEDVSEITIRNLPNGNYTLKEITAPSGYKAKTVKFTINKGIVTCEDDEGLADEDKLIQLNPDSETLGGGNELYTVVVKNEDSLLRFSKRELGDTTGTELEGAEFKLTRISRDADGKETEAEFNITKDNLTDGMELSDDNKSITWTSSKRMSITNIPNGTYKLEETKAPDGYEKAKPITITVSNGVITSATSQDDNSVSVNSNRNTVTVYDKLLVQISKQTLVENEQGEEANVPLEGATLLLTGNKKDADGNETTEAIEFTDDNIKDIADSKAEVITVDKDNNEVEEDGISAIRWESQKAELELQGLPNGVYTLTEIAPPDDTYEMAEPIKFTVTNGKITMKGTAVPDNTIVMIDDKKVEDKEISINKVDADGNDLEGATLILTGKQIITDESGPDSEGEIEGRTIEFDSTNVADTTAKVIDENGEEITSDGKGIAIQWVSDGEALVLKNLPDGKYTLEETVVPDGYTKAEDITFTVKNGDITEIDGKTVTDNKIDVTDNVSSIHISKKEVGGKDELPGAALKLTLTKADEEDATLENITVKQGETELTEEEGLEVSEDKKSVSFVSVEEFDTVFEKLPDGTYTLEETEVPQEDGENTHEQAENITFVIKNGVITSITLSDNDKENYKISDDEYENTVVSGSTATGVVMRDATTTTTSESSSTTITTTTAFTVRIDKVDETGTRVTGAKLSLTGTDEDGNPIVFNEENASKTYLVTGESSSTTTTTTTTESGASSDETKETVTATKLAWISGDKEVVFNLPAGTYVLHEDEAPTDYEKAEDITFIVDDEGNIIVVTEVKDEEGNTTKDEEGNIITATATTDKIQMTDIKITTSSTSSSTTTTTTTITTATVNIVKIGSDSSTTIRNLKGATLSLTGQDGTTPIVFGEEYKDYFTASSTTSTSSTSTTSGVTTTTEGIAVQADEDVSTSSALSGNTSTDTSVSSTTGTTADDTKETVTATKLIWISGEKAFPIGLPAGEYTLVEESAPDEYLKADKIVFTVDEEGKVTRKDGIEVKDNTIEMIDEKVTTSTTTTTTTSTTTTTTTSTTTTTTTSTTTTTT